LENAVSAETPTFLSIGTAKVAVFLVSVKGGIQKNYKLFSSLFPSNRLESGFLTRFPDLLPHLGLQSNGLFSGLSTRFSKKSLRSHKILPGVSFILAEVKIR